MRRPNPARTARLCVVPFALATLGASGLAASAPAQASAATADTATVCAYVPKALSQPKGYKLVHAHLSDGATRVAGYAGGASKTQRAVVWTKGTPKLLAAPQKSPAEAVDVNRHAVVLGNVFSDRAKIAGAYIWVKGKATRLGKGGTGVALNDSGLIVGTAKIKKHKHVVYWTVKHPGTRHDLGRLAGEAVAVGVSAKGTIVANTYDTQGTRYGVTGTTKGLKRLKGLSKTRSGLSAVAGNYLAGIGSSTLTDGPDGPFEFRWHNGEYTPLPYRFTTVAINGHGVTVGGGPFGAVLVVGKVPDVALQLLPLYASDTEIAASDVLADDSIVGTSSADPENRWRAVVWRYTCSAAG